MVRGVVSTEGATGDQRPGALWTDGKPRFQSELGTMWKETKRVFSSCRSSREEEKTDFGDLLYMQEGMMQSWPRPRITINGVTHEKSNPAEQFAECPDAVMNLSRAKITYYR